MESNGFKSSLWTHPFINSECSSHEMSKTRNGNGCYVDFTNPEEAARWSNALRNLLATSGIDILKFDAGENEYRTSRRSQEFARLLRMIYRNSRWDFQRGLPTLITYLVHLNMVGYPFVLPDIIGGNGYYDSQYPSKEMYERWMQANVFTSVVQFSYTPWDFDQQVTMFNKFKKKSY
ncbi:LOW QUALITY PROTEIN: myogenesis-regulating glycosidase-like [Metopolophium dirhodum]|uniref:LOW QUALITY PROTEIN: myogenesis-regulating glycosidase-like n=1 Tax=Metopolophium dirhodum TaxID=44670 RepID=UPI00298FC956|nr:LOW QUALITY PROTEIN: myogenesis-regulating glycosidase-like [Metopolophium dirhodum]